MATRTLVIVNPASRGGATGRRWPSVEARVRERLGDLDVAHTKTPGEAERIAREGVRAGAERVVVAGGDGTVSEVVTGLLSADLGEYAQLGILPLGTGGDFVRAVGGGPDLDAAIERLSNGRIRVIDAGRVTFQPEGGARPRTRYFANVTSFGISGLVDQLVARSPTALGGTVAFLLGTVRALFGYRARRVAVRVDGEPVFDDALLLGVAANGRYFGGGMRAAPKALLDDGLLDVWILADEGRLRMLTKLPLLYQESDERRPQSFLGRGRVIEAEATDGGTVWLDVDGEPLGLLPARVEVLPDALTLFGCSE